MPGSYDHITHTDGTPYDEGFGYPSLIENGGDVVETLEELYGMIWYLAERVASEVSVHGLPARAEVMEAILEAVENHSVGLERGKSGN